MFSLLAVIALLVVYLPYVVKRAVVMGTPSELYWLAWDYSIRVVSLVGVFACWRSGFIKEQHFRASTLKVAAVFMLALFFLFSLDAYAFPMLAQRLPYLQLFRPPAIRNGDLLLFDLTIGLALVAISEELAFRKVAFSVLRGLGFGDKGVVLLSSLVFALVHLTSGLDAALNVFLIGLILGTVFCVTGRLSVCIILHYLDHALGFGRLVAGASLGGAG